MIDGGGQTAITVTANDSQVTGVDMTHTGQTTGTHACVHNYKKNANGTPVRAVSNISVP